MTTPVDYGVLFNNLDDDLQPMQLTDMSTLYVVGTSEDATPAILPLNQSRMFNSSDPILLANAGTGNLAIGLRLVNANLGPFQLAARVIVHRVAKGASAAETITNIIGNQANGTGIYGALSCGERFGVIPRLHFFVDGLTGVFSRSASVTTVTRAAKFGGNVGGGLMTLGAPAYLDGVKVGTYQVRCVGGARSAASAAAGTNAGNGTLGSLTADAAAAVGAWSVTCQATAANGGTFVVTKPDGSVEGVATVGVAYDGGINFTLADGATDFAKGDRFTVTVAASVPVNGGLFEVKDPDGVLVGTASVGTPFATQVAFTIADGGPDFAVGDGFDVQVSQTGGVATTNEICAALPQVLNATLANAIVSGPGTTAQDDHDWRETLSSDRLIPVSTWATAVGMAAGTYIEPGPIAAGIGVRVDAQTKGFQGVPSQSFANQAVYGITDLKRYDGFSLSDGANDGQQLLADDIGIIQRGETGVETAAVSSGYVLICYANAGTVKLNRFFNVTRTRDYANLQILKAWRARIGKTNITRTGIQAFENDADAILSRLQTDEHIIGYDVGPGVGNTPETIRAGRFRYKIKNEPASPFLVAEADVYRDRDALLGLLADVAGTTNAALTVA